MNSSTRETLSSIAYYIDPQSPVVSKLKSPLLGNVLTPAGALVRVRSLMIHREGPFQSGMKGVKVLKLIADQSTLVLLVSGML